MIKGYQRVALGDFVAAEAVLFASGTARALFELLFVSGSGVTGLLLSGGVIVFNWFAAHVTADLTSPGRQYAGLFAVAGGQSCRHLRPVPVPRIHRPGCRPGPQRDERQSGQVRRAERRRIDHREEAARLPRQLFGATGHR